MKKISAMLCILLLSSCLPVTAQTTVSACPLPGLSDVRFFKGNPAGGDAVAATTTEDNAQTWDLSTGGIYMTCAYGGGDTRVQILPDIYQACTAQKKDGFVTKLVCDTRS